MAAGYYFVQKESVGYYSDQHAMPDFGEVISDTFSDGPDVFSVHGNTGSIVKGVVGNGYKLTESTWLNHNESSVIDLASSNYTSFVFLKLPKHESSNAYRELLDLMLPDADDAYNMDVELWVKNNAASDGYALFSYAVFGGSQASLPSTEIPVSEEVFLMLAVSVDYDTETVIIFLDGETRVGTFGGKK